MTQNIILSGAGYSNLTIDLKTCDLSGWYGGPSEIGYILKRFPIPSKTQPDDTTVPGERTASSPAVPERKCEEELSAQFDKHTLEEPAPSGSSGISSSCSSPTYQKHSQILRSPNELRSDESKRGHNVHTFHVLPLSSRYDASAVREALQKSVHSLPVHTNLIHYLLVGTIQTAEKDEYYFQVSEEDRSNWKDLLYTDARKLSTSSRRHLLYQVACGMRYLHEQGLWWGRCRPDGVLWKWTSDKKIHAKIGVVDPVSYPGHMFWKNEASHRYMPGDMHWATPEVIHEFGEECPDDSTGTTEDEGLGNLSITRAKKTKPAEDVWQFGCLALFLLCGSLPWGVAKDVSIIKALLAGKVPPTIPMLGEADRIVVETCLRHDMGKRTSSKELTAEMYRRGWSGSDSKQECDSEWFSSYAARS